MFPISKYNFYVTPDNKTIAVSTYAGKTVKGVAKTDPRDTYDAEFGRELAAARCAMKVAKKRKARADKLVTKAYREFNTAYKYVEKMRKYNEDAQNEFAEAKAILSKLEARG